MRFAKLAVICYNINMDNGLRYNSITEYYKNHFGKKVYKLALNINATCPNRDGSIGYGGCIYCSGVGSGDYATIYTQIDRAKAKLGNKKTDCYIAYFQSYSNTYMSCDKLDNYVKHILADKEIVGISIATRPDCINDEMLDYLSALNKRTNLVIELGLQSVHNQTLKVIGRGHSYEDFLTCFNRLKEKNIKVCVHLMNGLPNETKEQMLETIKKISVLKPHSVKIHCTYIPKGTKLETMYNAGLYRPLELEEYIEILAQQLAVLNKSIYIERLTGDGERNNLVAPLWTLNKRYFFNKLNSYMKANNIRQGSYNKDN